MSSPAKPKALPCIVEVVVIVFILGLLPVIVVLCQGGLGGLILQDASMVMPQPAASTYLFPDT